MYRAASREGESLTNMVMIVNAHVSKNDKTYSAAWNAIPCLRLFVKSYNSESTSESPPFHTVEIIRTIVPRITITVQYDCDR